jgi:hypothetical protein
MVLNSDVGYILFQPRASFALHQVSPQNQIDCTPYRERDWTSIPLNIRNLGRGELEFDTYGGDRQY